MGLDKTLTIKQRRIDVYLPTLEAKDRWNQEAAKRGQSISQLVFELVELSLAPDLNDSKTRVPELETELAKLRQEAEELRKRNEELETFHKRDAEELAHYRDTAFVEPAVQRLDSRLIRLLSEAKTRTGEARPVQDVELVQALRLKGEAELKNLAAQLEALELHELVRKAGKGKGWVWNG